MIIHQLEMESVNSKKSLTIHHVQSGGPNRDNGSTESNHRPLNAPSPLN